MLIIICGFCPLAAASQQISDCRPKKDFLGLAGEWKDDVNGHTVTIHEKIETGAHRTVDARYKSGNNCPDPNSLGKPVSFPVDFDGEWNGKTSEISGTIYWCTFRTRDGKDYTTGIGYGQINLKESRDGMNLTGTYHGHSGIESISFTRLSEPPADQYGQVKVTLKAGAKLYKAMETTSPVLYTPPPGTHVIIVSAAKDANGNATWYFVTNGEAGGVGGPNHGYIPAGKVVCKDPGTPKPASMIFPEVNELFVPKRVG